jgi:hypothetical protein
MATEAAKAVQEASSGDEWNDSPQATRRYASFAGNA